LRDVFLPGGEVADVIVDGDRIAAIGTGAAASLPAAEDCSGKLLLPAFVDGHMHLDKALIRDELREHDGTLGRRAPDEPVRPVFVLRAVTEAPALAARLTNYGLKAGARADLQLLPVPSWEEALRLQPPPEKVWFAGRLVAENSVVSTLHRRA
jgi:cytosine/adenosine deaminase-related metal-dependent hydrolase